MMDKAEEGVERQDVLQRRGKRSRREMGSFQQIKCINKCYVLFLDGEPATLKATHGVKTPLNVDLGDASLQTNLAVTTRPSAASLNPASPIH